VGAAAATAVGLVVPVLLVGVVVFGAVALAVFVEPDAVLELVSLAARATAAVAFDPHTRPDGCCWSRPFRVESMREPDPIGPGG
jgi:sugar/nucleoside kinase (ribokinase family)